jgi:hypothetical protein
MRRLMLMVFVLVLGASVALAEDFPGGRIGIFGENTGTNCAVTDAAPGLLNVYIVQVGTEGSAACQYKATQPACFPATYLSDSSPFAVVIGNSQTGVSIGYGSCRVGAVHVQTMAFFATGTTAPCCLYTLGCDPLSETQACALGYIDIVDCTQTYAFAKPQVGVINPNASCACVDIVAQEESSWGQIKALYQE